MTKTRNNYTKAKIVNIAKINSQFIELLFFLGVAVAQRLAPFGVARFLYSDVNKKSENGVYEVEIKINHAVLGFSKFTSDH